MFEYIRARDNAARTVTEHVHRQAGIFSPCDLDQLVYITQVVRKLLDVKSLAFRLAPAAEVQSVSGKTGARKLLARPCHVAAVRVKAVNKHCHRTRRTLGSPRTHEYFQTAHTFECLFIFHFVSLV